MPRASSLVQEGEDGAAGSPSPLSPFGFPRTTGQTFFPWGPGLGNCPGRSGARSRRESSLSPRLRLRRCPPPRRAVHYIRAPETISRNCPRRFPGAALGTLEDSGRRRRRRAVAVTHSQAPGPPPLLPGIPFRLHPPGPRKTLPSGGRASSAPRPRPAPRRESPGPRPLPPDARPQSRTQAAMVTGQRRGAGSWAGRLGGLFLSLPPPLFLLPPY